MSDVSQVHTAVARSRVAEACGDDHCTTISRPTRLRGPARARAGLTELSDQLSLVYTPASDLDANRTLVEVRASHVASSRILTIGETREALLADARTLFETLTRIPEDLLRHIGSPLHQISVLLSHRHLPHDQLGSIEQRCALPHRKSQES